MWHEHDASLTFDLIQRKGTRLLYLIEISEDESKVSVRKSAALMAATLERGFAERRGSMTECALRPGSKDHVGHLHPHCSMSRCQAARSAPCAWSPSSL
jgi:hypothetical protein